MLLFLERAYFVDSNAILIHKDYEDKTILTWHGVN
jgi:hypothetical protein